MTRIYEPHSKKTLDSRIYRRHAERTVQLWVQRLKDSSSTKRLSLMYLANGKLLCTRSFPSCPTDLYITEVAQQSKIRHKDDFIVAFSPAIAEAVSIAYKGAAADIQLKLKRVIDVWRDRSIFEAPIQSAIDARVAGQSNWATFCSGMA